MLTSELKYTYTGQGRAYPKQGSLKEIGARIGDVVEDGEGKKYDMVTISKSIKHSSAKFYKNGELVALEIDGLAHQAAEDSFMPIWRIISRAPESPTSPIRTVTRTTKEIVPGVYGAVEVYNIDDGDQIGVTMDCGMSPAELRAAAITLTEIADALEDNN